LEYITGNVDGAFRIKNVYFDQYLGNTKQNEEENKGNTIGLSPLKENST